MFDQRVQLTQVIARNANIHVVLGVEVHMPVQKANNRVRHERSAAKPKIGHVVPQADMLGVIA